VVIVNVAKVSRFLKQSLSMGMHAFDRKDCCFCWLAKAHDVKGAFSQENDALGEQAAQTRSTLSQGRLFAMVVDKKWRFS